MPKTRAAVLAARLAAMDEDAVATLLRRVPDLALALRGAGPHVPRSAVTHGQVPLPATAEAVAQWLLTAAGRSATLHALTDVESRVLHAVADRPETTVEELLVGVDRADHVRVRAALATLEALTLLGGDGDGPVTDDSPPRLRDDLAQLLQPPGRSLRRWLTSLRLDDLRALATAWFDRHPELIAHATGRQELLDLLHDLLADSEQLLAGALAVDPTAPDVLAGVVQFAPFSCFRTHRDASIESRRVRMTAEQERVLRELARFGIVLTLPYLDGQAPGGHPVRAFEVDVSRQLAAQFAPPLVLPPPVEAIDAQSVPAPDTAGDPSRVDRDLLRLVETWDSNPPAALAGGGLGKRAIRLAADELGLESGDTGVLAALALDLGLLGRVETGRTGRGRNLRTTSVWRASRRYADWCARPAPQRWESIVRRALSWQSPTLDAGEPLEKLDEPVPARNEVTPVRQQLLRTLLACPPGEGLTRSGLHQRLLFDDPDLTELADRLRMREAAAHVLEGTDLGADIDAGFAPDLDPETITRIRDHDPALAQILDPLRLPAALADPVDVHLALFSQLGLVAVARDVIAATDVARALVADDTDGLALLFGSTSTDLVVQSDLTVIAPPDLAPTAAARLGRMATLETSSGASIHRLDERRIAQAVGSGEPVAALQSWLEEASGRPLPDTVQALFADVARRASQLTVHPAGSVLVADDALALRRALDVKAAKLTLVAPTVAVSTLSLPKLHAALLAQGVVVTGPDGASGVATVAGVGTAPDGRPDPEWQRMAFSVDDDEPPRLLPPPVDEGEIVAAARAVRATVGDGTRLSDSLVLSSADPAADRDAIMRRSRAQLLARRTATLRGPHPVPW